MMQFALPCTIRIRKATSMVRKFNWSHIRQNRPISITFSDGLCHLSWRGGRLLQATNILGPWATNTWVSPQVFAPTGQMQFFNLVTNIF